MNQIHQYKNINLTYTLLNLNKSSQVKGLIVVILLDLKIPHIPIVRYDTQKGRKV